MCTALPPPSPPQPPKYVPKDPPTPPKPTVHGPHSAKTLQLIRENHGGGVQYFVDGVLNRRAMYRFAVQQPKKNPLRVWQEGMRISRPHFLSSDEEHAAVLLEILCATPKPPRIPMPAAQPMPRRPLPSPPSDQVTLTQYSRHRRTSLLPLAPAPNSHAPPRSTVHCSSGMRLSPPPHRRGRNLGHCSLRKPPCSDPRLRRDVRSSSSSASVHRASLTHRPLFQMAPKWLAKTKYGAKLKPQATAPPPPPPLRAPEAQHATPILAMAPADSGAPQGAPPSAHRMRAVEPQQYAPVPALAPVDWGARHGAPPSAPRMPALEPQQSAHVPAMAPLDSGARQGAPPSAPRMRAPNLQQSALVAAMAPLDSGARQGTPPSSQRMRALEPQQSAHVTAMAPLDSGARQGAPPSAPRMRAPNLQQSALVAAMAPLDSGARQGAPPSSQRMRALEPQQSAPVPAMAP